MKKHAKKPPRPRVKPRSARPKPAAKCRVPEAVVASRLRVTLVKPPPTAAAVQRNQRGQSTATGEAVESGEASSAIHLYMREMGKVDLLTPQQEVELAGRIHRGDDAAREHMIKANLRLVVKIARDYEGLGLPLLDLINEGNIGLMRAVERFDPAKGAKFSTYSAWWIKQSMRRAIANQSKTIRLPSHVVDKLSVMRRAALKLQEVLGREPTNEELALEVGMPARKVARLREASIRPASLDMPIGDDDSSRLADIVPDERSENPYQHLEDRTMLDLLRELVTKLEQREERILRFRFGLDGGPERTLEEVGRRFGVTRERIRQLQNIALLKLRRMIERREAVAIAA